jgi:hypothetical protein
LATANGGLMFRPRQGTPDMVARPDLSSRALRQMTPI